MMLFHAWTSALTENQRPMLLTRRQILASSVAMAGTIPFLPITRASAAPETAHRQASPDCRYQNSRR